jgi:peptidoglycan hydrolase-like protein with peptidoglycan-binding domain
MGSIGGSVPTAGSLGLTFSRNLTVGSTGADVKALQEYLNAHSFEVAASGPGSSGNETTTFGAKTKEALARWQASVGISPAAGYFGPKTRAYIAAH